MRPIKFRCWDALSDEMLNDVDIEERRLRDLDGDNDQIYMQYAGVKDKNGKEVYFGDIVKLQKGYGSEPHFQVTFDEFMTPIFKKIRGDFADTEITIREYLRDGKEFEVIGNIYQNPELLKNK